jgi:hypothetical protein
MDLIFIYFTNGEDIKSGMDLGTLKGNVGAQNYFLGNIANNYVTVVIPQHRLVLFSRLQT